MNDAGGQGDPLGRGFRKSVFRGCSMTGICEAHRTGEYAPEVCGTENHRYCGEFQILLTDRVYHQKRLRESGNG